jgi:DNA-binding transcriptional LysR family regulator
MRRKWPPARASRTISHRAWDQWEALTGHHIAPGAGLTFPHTHLCIQAALSGLGVALIEQRLIQAELAAGTLVAPYGFTAFGGGLMAVPATRDVPADADVFIAWLQRSSRRRRPTLAPRDRQDKRA